MWCYCDYRCMWSQKKCEILFSYIMEDQTHKQKRRENNFKCEGRPFQLKFERAISYHERRWNEIRLAKPTHTFFNVGKRQPELRWVKAFKDSKEGMADMKGLPIFISEKLLMNWVHTQLAKIRGGCCQGWWVAEICDISLHYKVCGFGIETWTLISWPIFSHVWHSK